MFEPFHARLKLCLHSSRPSVPWLALPLLLLLLGAALFSPSLTRAVDPPVTVSGRWTNFDHTFPPLPNPEGVTAVAASPASGQFWVGTNGSGVFVFDGETWTNHTVATTGGGVVISGTGSTLAMTAGNSPLLTDGSHRVWIGTFTGARRIRAIVGAAAPRQPVGAERRLRPGVSLWFRDPRYQGRGSSDRSATSHSRGQLAPGGYAVGDRRPLLL